MMTPIELYQILIERFNESELRTLCFHLGVDYDCLPGQGTADKARELIAHHERRQNVPQLAKAGQQLRPDISWGDISETHPSIVRADSQQSLKIPNQTRLVWVVIVTTVLGCIAGIIGALFAPSMTAYLQKTPIAVSTTVTTPATQSEQVPIAIDATKDWQPTGIVVNKGDKVSIRVVGGKWTAIRMEFPTEARQQLPDTIKNLQIFVNYWYEQSGEGMTSKCVEMRLYECPIPTAPVGALVAKIESGDPFFVGTAIKLTASQSGMVYLRINDGEKEGIKDLRDNFGVLAVEVTTK